MQVENAEKRGRPIPEWFEECPIPSEGDDFYMTAFWRLCTCRPGGMDLGAIPWDRMRDYARDHGLDEDTTEAFYTVIGEMDAAYLQWHADERERNKKKKD